MNLSVLESRLLHELPEECEEIVQKEFSLFEMETPRVSDSDNKLGQATLTRNEIERAKTTNQHGSYGHTVVELQAIKGAAMNYGIDDWLSYVDPELTHEENINIMGQLGNPSSKKVNAKRKAKTRY